MTSLERRSIGERPAALLSLEPHSGVQLSGSLPGSLEEGTTRLYRGSQDGTSHPACSRTAAHDDQGQVVLPRDASRVRLHLRKDCVDGVASTLSRAPL